MGEYALGSELQKELDEYLLDLQGEKDALKRQVILGKMIKAVGYTFEKHCIEDAVKHQNLEVRWVRTGLTFGGVFAALAGIGTVLWWIIQILAS